MGSYYVFNRKIGREPYFAWFLSILLIVALFFVAVYTYTDDLSPLERDRACITELKGWGRADMVEAVAALMKGKNIKNPGRIYEIEHWARGSRHMFAISYWEGIIMQKAYYSSTGGFVTEEDFNTFRNIRDYKNIGLEFIQDVQLTMVLKEAVALCH